MNAVLYVLFGLVAGILGGLIGIGGGVIIVKERHDENHENI